MENQSMKFVNVALMSLALASSASFADCDMPDSPTLPEGGSASMEDMLAGQKSVKTFQTANLDYMACLEEAFTSAEKAADSASADDKAAAVETYDKAIAAYNAAVSKEEEVAGQFNTEIREYKAANPG
jgi:hypothetical protein